MSITWTVTNIRKTSENVVREATIEVSDATTTLVFTANFEHKNPLDPDFIAYDSLTETNLVDWAKALWGQENVETAVTNKTAESSWVSVPWNLAP